MNRSVRRPARWPEYKEVQEDGRRPPALKRVLLVEDDGDLAELLADLLRDRYDVETAHDGVDGLAALERDRFDVVIVDVVMPVLDGESMLREMRARGIAVPAIISSGTPDLTEVATRVHAAAVLAKPYDADDLMARIEFAISPATE